MNDALPNVKALHELARTLAGTSDDHDRAVNIDGPDPGEHTSCRVTAAGKHTIDAAYHFLTAGMLF